MSDARVLNQPEGDNCPATVSELMCIQADITVSPLVCVGDVCTYCCGAPVIGPCPTGEANLTQCTFTVSQTVCVRIPLTFAADVAAEPTGVVCGIPVPGTGCAGPALG